MDKSQKNRGIVVQIVACFGNVLKTKGKPSLMSDNDLLRHGIGFANTALNLHGRPLLARQVCNSNVTDER